MRLQSSAQARRQRERGQDGRYVRVLQCDLCGRPAALTPASPTENGYYSDDRCNTYGGWGLVLHKRCAVKLAALTDDQYAELAAEKR